MLVDHLIKLDVEPELRLPPPRSIRRRSGRGFLLKPRHVLFLPFILLAVILLLALSKSLGAIIVGQRRFQASTWTFIFVTLFWNGCTAIYIWRIYALPLVHRWLVVHGQPALGHITSFTQGSSRGGVSRVHFDFSPIDGFPMKGNAVVDSMNVWKELTEGNTVITVVYYEKNPRWNVPYICVDYEVVRDA